MTAVRETWPLAALLVVAAALRLATLDAFGFGVDEVATARSTRLGLAEMLDERLRAGHPPLYFLLTWGLARLGGDGEWLLRLPGALAGIAAIPLLYRIVEPFAGRPAALAAAALLAVSPANVALSQLARPYVVVELLGLAAARVVARAETGERGGRAGWRAALAFAALSAAAAYVHYSGLLVLAALLGHLLVRRRPLWRLAAGGLGALAAFVPWLVVALRLDQGVAAPIGWVAPLSETTLPLLLRQLLLRALLPPGAHWAALASVAIAATVALAVLGAAGLGRRGRLLAWLALGPPALGLAVAVVGPNLLGAERWYATSGAALLGLAAAGALGGATGTEGAGRLRPAAFACLVAASLAGCAAVLRAPHGLYDWRRAAEVLTARHRAGEEVLLFVDAPQLLRLNLSYYWPGEIGILGEEPERGTDLPGLWLATTDEALEGLTGAGAPARPAVRRHLERIERRFPHRESHPIGTATLLHFTAPEGRRGSGLRPRSAPRRRPRPGSPRPTRRARGRSGP